MKDHWHSRQNLNAFNQKSFVCAFLLADELWIKASKLEFEFTRSESIVLKCLFWFTMSEFLLLYISDELPNGSDGSDF